MTAISLQMQKTTYPRLHGKRYFETFLRVLITLSAAMSVILSSISVCDGQWIAAAEEQFFGLWHNCRKDTQPPCDVEIAQLDQGKAVVRTAVSLAVVVAIFGLELLIVSQVCDDGNSRRKWSMGSVLLLIAFFLSSVGTVTYVTLLEKYITSSAFSLTFWCQFLAIFLFFLNGISGLYFNRLTA
ncbi:voltage-dependent calcium channel gamma-like subunit [Pelodytes ibericus]